LIRSHFLSEATGADVYLKLESEQKLRSFKLRGVLNRLLTMSSGERSRGIAVVSSGNHGAAASYAGQRWGVPVEVWVPATTPGPKVNMIRRYGANVHLVGETYDEAAEAARGRGEGPVWIDPSSDEVAVTGHGSIALEILEDLPGVDAILVPVGGGGLLAGVSATVKTLRGQVEMTGVQTAACPALVASLADGVCYEQYPTRPSLCEALVGGIGPLGFEYAQLYVDQVVQVTEPAIARAAVDLIDHDQVMAEPSAAVGAAYLLENPDEYRGRTVAVIISGGNLSLATLRRFLGRRAGGHGRRAAGG
jgi:threonine dehydratase